MSTLVRDDYAVFCDGIRRLAGIDLLQYKRGQMERRIRTFASRRGAASLDAYLATLRDDRAQLDALLDRITINVSQLWRNPEQWERVRTDVLPALAERGHIRAWSAGCSYGAEAFTLAAVCRETVPGARVEIVGTDIDARMIARAREAVFSIDDARSAPPAAIARHFERVPDGLRARAELRRTVRFSTGDLLRDRFPREGYDLVLCRNVVIYFTDAVRDDLHARLAGALRPWGSLVIGSSERVATPAAIGLIPTHPFIYRKA